MSKILWFVWNRGPVSLVCMHFSSFLSPFVSSHWFSLGTLVEYQLTLYALILFWVLCSILVCVYLYVVLYCFIMLHLYSTVWSQEVSWLCFCCYFSVLLWLFRVFCSSTKILGFFSISVKNAVVWWAFCRWLWVYGHSKNINSSSPWTWGRKNGMPHSLHVTRAQGPCCFLCVVPVLVCVLLSELGDL